MNFIKVNKPVTFESLTDIIICRQSGALFLAVRAGKLFNLPKGRFIVYGAFKRTLENFSINLPANEKKEKPRKLNVVFTNNPNKLSIDIKTGTVYADKKFWNSLNEIQQRFVIAHELGHFKYYNETKADKFAAYLLLKSGYNPTQIVACINSTLSENSQARKNRIYNFLKTVKK